MITKYTFNTIFHCLLFIFLVFAASELARPSSVSVFFPFGWLVLALFVFAALSIIFAEEGKGKMYPLVSVLLTLTILGCTIFFAWRETRELGKIGLIATAGALMIMAAALKQILGQEE